jgi:hypothetical protein
MATDQLIAPGSFCWNPTCRDYAKLGKHNIIKFRHTRRGVVTDRAILYHAAPGGMYQPAPPDRYHARLTVCTIRA